MATQVASAYHSFGGLERTGGLIAAESSRAARTPARTTDDQNRTHSPGTPALMSTAQWATTPLNANAVMERAIRNNSISMPRDSIRSMHDLGLRDILHSPSKRQTASKQADIALTPELKLFYDENLHTVLKNRHIVHTTIEYPGISSQPTSSAPTGTRLRQSQGGPRPVNATEHTRAVLGRTLVLPHASPRRPRIADGTLRQGWTGISPGSLIYTHDIVNISLEGRLQRRDGWGRHCHLVYSSGAVVSGTVRLSDIRAEMARQLNIADPLTLQLDLRSDPVNNSSSCIQTRKGWRHACISERTPIDEVLNLRSGWIRIRLVEYIKLEIESLDLVSTFTPSSAATVGQLRQLAATIAEQDVSATRLFYRGEELINSATRLKSLSLEPKSTIAVILNGTECSSCYVTKASSQFTTPITPACTHERSTCPSCVNTWISGALTATSWNRISCPECDQLLQQEQIKQHAGDAAFKVWDRLATRAALNDIPGFRWCMSSRGCESGQIHMGGTEQPCFKCVACKFRSCVLCNRMWHQGETCAQVSDRLARAEQASKELVGKISKQCPGCKSRIEKNGGCDHMTCQKCTHEFCWLCLADYKGDNGIRRRGNAAHEASCPHHS